MYCKNCGKEIADDSRFCQYCGTAQQQVQETVPVVGKAEDKSVAKATSAIANLSTKAKIGIGIYVIWFLVNFLCIFLDYIPISYASEDFYPFYDEFRYCHIESYDFTEFFVYVVIAPVTIFVLYKAKQYVKRYFGWE